MNLYLLLVGEIFLIFCSYIIFRDLLSPSFNISILFFIASVMILPYQKLWNINYCFEATFLLLSGLTMFFLVEVIVVAFNRVHKYKNETDCINSKIYDVPVVYQIISIIVILLTIFLLWKEIVRIGSAWSYNGLTSNLMRNYRNRIIYGYDSVNFWTSQLMKISSAVGYISAFIFVNNIVIGGINQVKKNMGFLITALLLIILQLENSTRGTFINYIIYIVVIYYIKFRWIRGWNSKNDYKIIRTFIIAVAVIAFLFIGSRSIIGRDITESAIDNVARYYGGPIQLFNLYVQNPTHTNDLWGTETFTGIYQSLHKWGAVDYRQNMALEFRHLGSYSGNVYTMFRRPLHDFGVGGMYLFTFSVASMFCCMYYKLLENKRESDLRLIYYAYFYHWIGQAVVECYSFNFGTGSIISLVLLAIIFFVFTKIRFVFGEK